MELALRRFVRPEHMNHHQTMYAGRISEWVTEAAMIGVTCLLGRNDGVVLAAVKEVQVTRPILAGTVLELWYETGHMGTTSIEIEILGKDMLTGEEYVRGSAVFVTVDADGRKMAHGLGNREQP